MQKESTVTFKMQKVQFFKIEINSGSSQVNIQFKNFIKINSANSYTLLRANYHFYQEQNPDLEDLGSFYKNDPSFKLGNDKVLTLTSEKVIENSTQMRILEATEGNPLYVYLAMYSD